MHLGTADGANLVLNIAAIRRPARDKRAAAAG
jgi:hypothetical protein